MSSQKKSFLTTPNVSYETLGSTGKMKVMMKYEMLLAFAQYF